MPESIASVRPLRAEQQRALAALNAARANYTSPCQEDPKKWDENSELPHRERMLLARQAKQACWDCEVFYECRIYAAASPELSGVIAGEIRIKTPGRPVRSTTGSPSSRNNGGNRA